MLLKLHGELEAGAKVTIEKWIGERDVSRLGAFPFGAELTFRITLPRLMGASAVVLRIGADGEGASDRPLTFCGLEEDRDVYALTLDTATLCRTEDGGLFFYEFLFLRGWDTLFTDSINNVDFALSASNANRFTMLIHRADFHTPAWFRGGTMYHVFLDRFCRGEGEYPLRPGASLDGDWEHGIPQFAPKNGDPLKNNVYFGGNLQGVCNKLDYLRGLGVTVLYLSPIFEADTNHRYDTADYECIDPLLGTHEDFAHLTEEAHARGMRVILDGVFNHTGDDSKYFNRRGNYGTVGAYQSTESPYSGWYTFGSFPDKYECWWGIEILPRLNQKNPDCRRYFTGKEGIVRRWLLAGADGWRLDVADELPDAFLDEMRATVKETTGGEGLIIGEVWENAATKIAYGKRRRYFGGRQLDSVMNYPFRSAVLAFLTEGDASFFYNSMTEIYASYPKEVSDSLMNLLGSHDTERILTVLGGDSVKAEELSNAQLAVERLSASERKKGISLLKMASTLQYTVFGVPSLYYGDEAGLEGYHDPFCRMPYPWGREDEELLAHYRHLGKMRMEHQALRDGDFRFLMSNSKGFAYERRSEDDVLVVAANMSKTSMSVPIEGVWRELLTGKTVANPTVGEGEIAVYCKAES